MKKWEIKYKEQYFPSPMSFWVHKNLDCEIWNDATEFDPKLPKPIPGKGFPVLFVKVLGIELIFSSIEEAEHFLDVIKKKNMPTSIQLSKLRNINYGPNTHWLSRLPSEVKSWKKREKLIPIIEKGIIALKAAYS